MNTMDRPTPENIALPVWGVRNLRCLGWLSGSVSGWTLESPEAKRRTWLEANIQADRRNAYVVGNPRYVRLIPNPPQIKDTFK